MLTTVLAVLALISSGLLAGAQFVLAFAVAPAMRMLAGTSYVQLHQLLDTRMDPTMPAIGYTSIAAAAVLFIHADPLPAKIACAGTVVLTGAVGFVSERFNKPINRQVVAWDHEALPVHWDALRSRWVRANLVRTVCSALAFVATTTAVLLLFAGAGPS